MQIWIELYGLHTKPHSSVGSTVKLENRRSLVRSLAYAIFFPRIDESHCDKVHSSLTAVRCCDNSYVGKQPLAWKEYCAEYWLKEFQESMDRCTGRHNITEILLKMELNTIQSINKVWTSPLIVCKCQVLGLNKFKIMPDDKFH